MHKKNSEAEKGTKQNFKPPELITEVLPEK